MVNTKIAFKLINLGKTIIQTTGDGDLKNSIYTIFGKEIASGVNEVNYTYEDITIQGVVGRPEIARSNKVNQMYFINNRYVKDKTLASATEQAYKGLLPIGKFAFCALDIKMSPSKVDVNVHPAKLEVRFEEEGKVFKAVYHAIRNTLLSDEMINNTEKEVKEFNVPSKTNRMETMPVSAQPINNSIGGLFKKFKNMEKIEEQKDNVIEELFKSKNIEEKSEKAKELYKSTDGIIETPTIEKVKQATHVLAENSKEQHKEQSKNFEEMYTKLFGTEPVGDKQEIENIDYPNMKLEKGENLSVFEPEEKYMPIYKFIGIAFSTYIIIEIGAELYIIDQHAAHERIMYEKVKKNFYKNESKDSQLMLVPDVITLTHKEMDIVKENIEMFKRAGFVLEEFGDNTIKLTGVPNICMELNTKQLFLDILDEIDTVAITARQEKEDKFIATIACKAAVKANMNLTKNEVDNLMANLLPLPNPFTCPHGRPTAIKMTKTDIEKKFSRK